MISGWILFAYFLSVQCQQTSITYNQPTNKVITAGKYHCSFKNPSCLTSTLSEACGLNGNTDTICSPKPEDLWKNGTWYPITWNPMYPSYVASPTLDIYIYFIRNYQNILVKKITNINTSKGTVPVLVDNSWRLDSSAHTYNTMIYILPSELDPDKELENRFSSDYPPPVYNRVEQLALVPILASLSITSTSQSLSSFTTTVSSTLSNSRPISISTPSPTSSDSKQTSDRQQQQQQQQQQ
ncbi:uncharacterized protein B0P05DRAFT_487479, partial [Gilbertella persicaria]|uniref:uncharacterized protein n=1 Tax=Gilbertella persicaria TaxID=101096 RepID=UPI0022206D13